MSELTDPRRTLLLDLFRSGLAAVHGRRAVHDWLSQHPSSGGFHLVAMGKAADAMTAGALDVAADSLRAGLVVTRYGHQDTAAYRDPRILSLEAGHPLPDERSLAAGNALRLFLREAPADARFIFLVSGGTSSIVEVPVPGVSLETLRELNLWLLGSGLPIGDVNHVRSALSLIKGGRLAQELKGRPATLLLMSDVPGDVVPTIGSGLLLPSPARPLPKLPERFASLPFQTGTMRPAPEVDAHIIASNGVARVAIVAAAHAVGKPAYDHGTFPLMDAAACGTAIAEFLKTAPQGVHIWGGETTVKLPSNPGQGGRNQHLALAAARQLAGTHGILLLAAGTDGCDGATDDAGALVDGGSVQRGWDSGYDAADSLARADAGAFLDAAGDLLYTGPTGTNVMDLVIGLKLTG